MALGAPDEANECQHHEHGNQSKPERLLQHALRERLVRDAHHAALAPRPLPPRVAAAVELSVLLEALAAALARVVGARLLPLIAQLSHVPLNTMALQAKSAHFKITPKPEHVIAMSYFERGRRQLAFAKNARFHFAHCQRTEAATEQRAIEGTLNGAHWVLSGHRLYLPSGEVADALTAIQITVRNTFASILTRARLTTLDLVVSRRQFIFVIKICYITKHMISLLAA